MPHTPGAHDDAVLTLTSSDADTATFDVEFVGKKNVNRYMLWVQLDAFDAGGVNVGRTEAGINQWVGDHSPLTMPLPLPGDPSVDHREAYVWLFPDNTTPVSNTVNV